MAANASLVMRMQVSDTLALPIGTGSYEIPSKIEKIFNGTSTSTPDVTQIYAATLALAAGTLTFELDTVTTLDGTAAGLNGLVVQAYAIKNNGANNMTFIAAAVNGYGMFTATNGTVVTPGDYLMQFSTAGFGTISASASDITVNGTGTQTFSIIVIAGAA